MEFWARMASTAERWDVLRHPFYLRWSAGELEPGELPRYAGQYAHAVDALACASDQAARIAPAPMTQELAEHAAEERAHVDLWRGFAAAVGAPSRAPALPETADCVAAWSDADRPLLDTLAALHAIESAQPAIAQTKLDGLRAHYGLSDGPGTEYFSLHALRDVDHAASTRRLIDGELEGADADAMVREAERVLAANWRLLDGVEHARTHAV